MNKYAKTFLGLLIIIIPALVTLGIFFNKLYKKSYYENSGEIKIQGLKSKVKIYSDEYGVPHIFAENEEDLYFAFGYMHAQDRLWQMDITRRAAEGKLSQIFGSSTLDYDKLFRTIGIDKFSYRWYNNISPKSRGILQAYSNGVNKFIELHINELPAEFDILNYKPEPWKPEHSLMIGRLMAWDLNINWYSDYAFREIIDKVGIEKASEIFPDTTMSIFKKSKTENDTLKTKQGALIEDSPIEAAFRFTEIYNNYRNFFGLNSFNSGSNSWVVSGEKTENGKPILANDPHLNLQAPSRWYEVHLKSSNIDVTGMSLSGTPAVLIGHNRIICWGLTSLMNDDNDFVLLETDSANGSKYKYKNQSFYPDSTVEKIEVKDSNEVYYTVRNTKIGPIVSDIKGDRNKFLTFRWTGFEYSDELETFHEISTARNWGDFKNALKSYGTPAQNFMYADTSGNIGYYAAGKVPVRKANGNEYFSFAENTEWTGFVEFDKLPNILNPKEGFLVTANTNPFEWLKPEPDKKYYISWTWEPTSRFDKIKEVLLSKRKFNINEFRLMQMNYQSLYAKDISKYITEAYKDYTPEKQEISDALNLLKKWNGEMKADSPEGAIYSVFLTRLIKNIYLDELSEKIFYNFLNVTNLPLRATIKLFRSSEPDSSKNSVWFDNINTPLIETKDEIIRKSFSEAVGFLKARFSSSDISTWRWGEIHRLNFIHPLGTVPELSKTFNIGSFAVGGDQTTINNSGYSFIKAIRDGTFENDLGPSMRMITDLSDITHSISINSTGQSGQPLHPDYYDQSRLWFYGEYKEITMEELEMIDRRYSLLILLPKN